MRTIYAIMLEELESSFPEVCKIPGRHGGYIRCCISVNAEWYRAFTKRYLKRRRRYPKPRTIIKRCDTIKALKRMVAGNTKGVYAERLISFTESWYMDFHEARK